MKKAYMPQRIIVFVIGLFINALSVALFSHAYLGTSPISSIPYTLYFGNQQLTLGQYEFILNMVLILGQVLLLRKNFKIYQLVQIVIALVFGLFIDFWMMIFAWLEPTIYITKLLVMVIGVLLNGVGVALIVLANVIMLCGEAFVTAVCNVFHTDFGKSKIVFDCALTGIACIISLVLYHTVVGVREGTLIAAIVVGWFSGIIIKHLIKRLPWHSAL